MLSIKPYCTMILDDMKPLLDEVFNLFNSCIIASPSRYYSIASKVSSLRKNIKVYLTKRNKSQDIIEEAFYFNDVLLLYTLEERLNKIELDIYNFLSPSNRDSRQRYASCICTSVKEVNFEINRSIASNKVMTPEELKANVNYN